MATITDNTALLLYRVGPVFCASPCQPISAIITPPSLTRPPGSNHAQPGIFKHADAIVRSLDLRYKFGVDEAHWAQPGRTVITQLVNHHIGFYVDEILDVISIPKSGWGALPALLPRGVFTRTLTLQGRIYLYADFNDLQHIPDSGYLRHYIQHLIEAEKTQQPAAVKTPQIPEHSSKSGVISTAADTVVRPATSTTTHNASTVTHAQQNKPKPQMTVSNTHRERKPEPFIHRIDRTNDTSSQTQKQATPAHRDSVVPLREKATTENQPRSLNQQQQAVTRPTNSSVVSSRTAFGITHSEAPTTPPSPVAAPSVSVSTSSPINDDHSAMLIVGLLLFLALTSGGIWYLLFDEPSELNTQKLTATTINDVSDEQTVFDDEKTTMVATTTPATPASAPPPAKSQETTSPDMQSASKQATPIAPEKITAPAPELKASEPQKLGQEYHASIEKDAQGLTITLDVPADDPAFTQDAQATTSADKNKTDDASVTTTNAASHDNMHATSPAPTPAQKPQSVEIIHIVVKGDTLWAIARRYVKNPFRYPELARLSKIKNPDLIYPGDRVRIIKQKQRPKPNHS